MAHEHIKRLNDRIAEARQKGLTDEAIIDILADAARQSPQGMQNLLDARDAAVKKNRRDVSSALEQIILTPNPFAATFADGTDVAKAVADAFTPDVTKATEPPLTGEEQERVDDLARKMRKVRGDINDNLPGRVG